MDDYPQKYDPKKQLMEELEVQDEHAQAFYIYLGRFLELLQKYNLENESEEVLNWAADAKEKRNETVSRYAKMKKALEGDGNAIMLEMEHQRFQKEVVKTMDYLIAETTYLRVPKELKDGTALDEQLIQRINQIRTAVLNQMGQVRERYYSNDLGQGGESVLV